MTARFMTNRAGLEFPDPGFRWTGRLLLKVLFKMSPSSRERLLFGTQGICLPLQRTLRRLLGGAFVIQGRFTQGLLAKRSFECSSSEKYFMLGSGFEADVQQILSTIVKPGDIVYDVGAHLGYMALLFSALSNPNGRVFTFEPSPINYARLMRNIDLNRDGNITVVHKAASDVEGVARLIEHGSLSSISSLSNSAQQGSSVATIRLDDFVYRDGNLAPTFLKIDVEGHAGACLHGMERLLRDQRPGMVLEIHDPTEDRCVTEMLARYQYAISAIDHPTRYPRRIIAKP